MYIILSTLFLIIVTGLLYVYWILKESHKFFDQYGIPYPKPHWFFGNMKDVVLWKKAIWFIYKDLYDKHVSNRFIGVYTLHTPTVMVRDPELIKSILVKDFSHFRNRGFPLDKDAEPLAENLINMSGDEWKNLRIKLTSTFSSGKMKMMFPLLKRCAEGIQPALKKYIEEGQDFEAKDLAGRYATDVIGSCAFGIDIHSLQNADSEFLRVGKTIFTLRLRSIIRGLFPKLPTSVIKYFKLHVFPVESCDYFLKLVTDMVKYREENNVTRGDFLDILIAMKNQKDLEKLKDQQDDADLAKFVAQISLKTVKSDVEMTIELMAAQCFLFFIGGFEGASTTLMLLLFEMAHNPDIQTKLRQEIISTLESNGGELTYEMMKKMPYLDMVLSEVWRRYPTGPILMRECTENYKIPGTDAVIKKGVPVVVPTMGLQMDKKYFEKPDQFYPEHFTEEAKRERHPFVYLPFGEGPRVCIAERFARMQVIVGAVYLLKDFSFELSPKTTVPLEFAPGVAVLVKGGVWVKCRPL
ncbi:probable cytochrome P450 6a13 isoform X1 [Planococcus citri]|uniref:probable cytochrome P450 6a13 isoform X1 n=1 Tax=Planococcus citri TaxID=170843 RepID=UPI0031F9F363